MGTSGGWLIDVWTEDSCVRKYLLKEVLLVTVKHLRLGL
jgi:hypothetical protein